MRAAVASAIALTAVLSSPSFAQGSAPEKGSNRSFAGLHFSAAISATVDLDSNRVESAVVEVEDEPGRGPTAFVRVTKADNVRARIMLESHYFWRPKKGDGSFANWGWGPFVAIQPGTDEIIDSMGSGLMIGFRHPSEPDRSFNLGVGMVVDSSVKILGSGFVAGDPAPIDAEGNPLAIRYEETSQLGAVLLFSFSF